ncbi:MAG: cyclase [Acidobacteria bacterium]|nr:MAG: cyclase [Acidobacteriota bacterium]
MALRKYNQSGRINDVERWVSAIAGGTLAFIAIRNLKNKKKRSMRGYTSAIGAGMMIFRSITGKSPVYQLLGIQSVGGVAPRSASVRHGKGIRIEKTVTIGKSPEELYQFWHHLENLPRFMSHIESVSTFDLDRSHWVVKAPAGTRAEWDAVIHNDIQNELIAWRTVDDSEVQHAGSVEFKRLPENRGTEVRVVFSYEPPGGRLGSILAQVLGEEPGLQVDEDLRRFKQLMEAGEIPSTEGQPNGKGVRLFEWLNKG